MSTETVDQAAPTRWATVQPWLSTAVRLAMAVILVAAAIPKLLDIPQSIRAVSAYQLLPEAVVPFIGTALPIVEIVLALFLAAGLFTRAAAIAWLVMMVGFSIGVVWAWSQGYSIDCGCFGGGGAVAEGTTNYPVHMLERAGFIIMGLYLAIWPASKWSADAWMRAA